MPNGNDTNQYIPLRNVSENDASFQSGDIVDDQYHAGSPFLIRSTGLRRLTQLAKRRRILVALGCIFTLILFNYGLIDSSTHWIAAGTTQGKYEHLLDGISRQMCQGEGRAMICEFTNMCISEEDGAFIIIDDSIRTSDIQAVNLMALESAEDHFWKPNFRHINDMRSVNIQVHKEPRPLLVYGAYSPFHFSHYLYNTLLPLYSTAVEFLQAREQTPRFDFWTFRAVTKYPQEDRTPFHDLTFITDGLEVMHDKEQIHNPLMQFAPPKTPICFAKAIVGMGNRCSLWYCERNIPNLHYKSFTSDFYNHFAGLDSKTYGDEECIQRSVSYPGRGGKHTIGLISRDRTRKIVNIQETLEMLTELPVKSVRLLDFNRGCSMEATASLLQDVNLLIGSHGNGLGDAIFLPDSSSSAVISIESRDYYEDWFAFVHTSVGRRFLNFMCLDEKCQTRDLETAKQILQNHNLDFDDNAEQLSSPHSPAGGLYGRLRDMQIERNRRTGVQDPIIDGYNIYIQYAKEADRKVDIPRLEKFLQRTLLETNHIQEWEARGLTYPELCEKGMACGPRCEGIMEQNVFGRRSAFPDASGSPHNWME